MTAGAVADLSGDGRAEAVFGSGGYLLHAWDASGAEPDGWPKFTGNWILGGAAVGDITGDGYLEVVAVTREGQLFAWTTDGPADQEVQWASIQHDPQNTGNFEMPLVQQEGPVLMDEAGGCCRSGNKQAGVWLLFPLGLGFLRRRGSS